jgi:hypothetical protein
VFYRFTPRFSASAKYRAGRNFPIPGYYAAEGGSFFVGMDRNALPLPVDGRLDLRANRTFAWPRRRPALFAEVINVLDQENVRFSPPRINNTTRQVTRLFDSLVPVVPSAGILVEFQRFHEDSVRAVPQRLVGVRGDNRETEAQCG